MFLLVEKHATKKTAQKQFCEPQVKLFLLYVLLRQLEH